MPYSYARGRPETCFRRQEAMRVPAMDDAKVAHLHDLYASATFDAASRAVSGKQPVPNLRSQRDDALNYHRLKPVGYVATESRNGAEAR
jgi:hypothetical protein